MKRKVIWIVNQYAGSPVHGMEYRHYYLAKEFVKQGMKVYIISGSYSVGLCFVFVKRYLKEKMFTHRNASTFIFVVLCFYMLQNIMSNVLDFYCFAPLFSLLVAFSTHYFIAREPGRFVDENNFQLC